MLKKFMLGTAVVAMFAFAGCSQPPEAEMAAAQSGLQQAMAAEAADYAPEALKQLQDSLNAIMAMKTQEDEKFALFRSYTAVKDGFVGAEAMAKNVATQAAQGKEAMMNEVTTMMTTVQAALDSTTALVNKAPVGKGNKAEIELIKNDLASVSASMADAAADFQNGKYKAAKAKLEAVMSNATRISGEITNAMMMKK